MLEKDAVSAGVSQVGGLFSVAEIRILICYILSAIDSPVPGRMLADTLHYEAIANCFEVNDSIAALVQSGHLKVYNPTDDTYVITPLGKDTAETLKTTLPLTVKDRAYRAVLKMVGKFNRAKEIDFEITKENDRMYLNCSAIDKDKPFMSIKLMVTDEDQANFIKERFLESNENIYATLLSLLTKHNKN